MPAAVRQFKIIVSGWMDRFFINWLATFLRTAKQQFFWNKFFLSISKTKKSQIFVGETDSLIDF